MPYLRLAFTATLKGVHYSKVIPEWAYNILGDKTRKKILLTKDSGSVIDKVEFKLKYDFKLLSPM